MNTDLWNVKIGEIEKLRHIKKTLEKELEELEVESQKLNLRKRNTTILISALDKLIEGVEMKVIIPLIMKKG